MDFSGGGNSAQINAGIEKVQSQYSWSGGSCVQLDKLIKDVRDRLVSERAKLLGVSNEYYIKALADQKNVLEMIFTSNSCSDRIETLRQNESAVLITKKAIEQEKTVLKTSNTDQKIYIVGGAVVLLVGLIILVKK
jgi:tRNA nucleotidyltransferase/poly(A) polymerase